MAFNTEHQIGVCGSSKSGWSTISSIDALAKAVFLWSRKDLRHDTWVSMEKHLLCDRSCCVSLLSSTTRAKIETPLRKPTDTHAHTPQSHVTIGLAASLRTRAAQGLVEEIDMSLISLNFALFTPPYFSPLVSIWDVLHRFSFAGLIVVSSTWSWFSSCWSGGLTLKSIVNEDIVMGQWNIYGVYRFICR